MSSNDNQAYNPSLVISKVPISKLRSEWLIDYNALSMAVKNALDAKFGAVGYQAEMRHNNYEIKTSMIVDLVIYTQLS